MPCNLYGPNDNFDLRTSHVLPALILTSVKRKRKFRRDPEKEVVWGSGTPLREFLHVDDLAAGVAFRMDNYDGYEPINCGAGSESLHRRSSGSRIADAVGFTGAGKRLMFQSLTEPLAS